MTVHGAKGLEAPFVILADATADPARIGGVSRTLDFPGARAAQGAAAPAAQGGAGVRRSRAHGATSKQRDLEEHWRLLYVGLTRAIERLVIAGVEPQAAAMAENSWHTRVERALLRSARRRSRTTSWGEALATAAASAQPRQAPKPPRPAIEPAPVPDWARRPRAGREPPAAAAGAVGDGRGPRCRAAAERRAARGGAARDADPPACSSGCPRSRRTQRGRAALRWLERSAGIADAEERQALADLVCAILDDPDFAALFGPGSLAEAPIAATLADGRVVAGTVDRLLVEDERVSVIDFKTGRVPATTAEIPASHRAQMAAYAEALAVIFPGRDVRAALLYTAAPRLFELAP